MSLDILPGAPGLVPRPPGPPGEGDLVSNSPSGDPAAMFAALLTQSTAGVVPGTAAPSSPAPGPAGDDRRKKQSSEADQADQSPQALAALAPPLPFSLTPAAPSNTGGPVGNREAMDTVSAPAVPTGMVTEAAGELLPPSEPNTAPVTAQPAGPGAPAPIPPSPAGGSAPALTALMPPNAAGQPVSTARPDVSVPEDSRAGASDVTLASTAGSATVTPAPPQNLLQNGRIPADNTWGRPASRPSSMGERGSRATAREGVDTAGTVPARFQPAQGVETRPRRTEDEAGEASPLAPAQALAAPLARDGKAAEGLPAAPTALTAEDRAHVIRQIGDHVQVLRVQAAAGGQGQMTLQLHPKEWGQVQLSVTTTQAKLADGTSANTVAAHVVAESPAVKAALETHSDELRHTLGQAGLHLDSLTITVQSAAAAGQAGTGLGDAQNSGQSGREAWGQAPSSGGPAPQGGGASFGGGQGPSPFAAFAGGQGGGGRHPQPPVYAPAAPDTAAPEPLYAAESRTAAILGRVDTRA